MKTAYFYSRLRTCGSRRRRCAVFRKFEIAPVLKIANQPGLLRLPSQPFPGQSAGRRVIQREEMPDPAKMAACLLGRLCNHGHVETSADYLSDLSNRSTLVGDAVKGSCHGSLLKNEPVEVSSIEPVHCGPAVKPVAHIGRD